MKTDILTYTSTLINKKASANLRELNIYDFAFLLNVLEKQLAIAEGGSIAIASKSFRSSRFSLIKQLADNKALHILSYEPESAWASDIALYNRYGIRISYAEHFPEENLKQIIRSQKIDVVYIASIHSKTLAVENHSAIITDAHSLNIPVIYDNTAGALGSTYQPLAHHADYVLVNTTGTAFETNGIGGYIAEALPKSVNINANSEFITESVVYTLKQKRSLAQKQQFLLTGDEDILASKVNQEIRKQQAYAKTTFTLAKLLNQVGEVAEVNYPGLKTSTSFINAESNLRSGYGKVLKFKVWDAGFSHNLLRSFFIAGKPAGLKITTDNELKEFEVTIHTDAFNEIAAYFNKVFSQLSRELEFRESFKRQLKLEAAVKELLKVNI
ncbi:MAG TPA: PLP-dependent transferase [Cytophagaceae bacterium]